MNVQFEPLPNCLATLRVDLPPSAVNEARENITRDYAAHAKLPGYRPGKAPREVVERKFQKEIREELERKLLSESTRAAITEKNLRVLQVQNVEDVEFSADQSLHFTATVITAPEFDLPEYRKIPVVVPAEEISEAEIDTAIENLRSQAATFDDITGRGLRMEDYAVIDYDGTIEGKPVSEVFPKAGKPLTTNAGFWVRMTPESFLPGFSEALLGVGLDETREFVGVRNSCAASCRNPRSRAMSRPTLANCRLNASANRVSSACCRLTCTGARSSGCRLLMLLARWCNGRSPSQTASQTGTNRSGQASRKSVVISWASCFNTHDVGRSACPTAISQRSSRSK